MSALPDPKRIKREKALGALVGAQLSAHLDKGARGLLGEVALSGRLASQWAAICPLLAPYCWPGGLRKGVLTVNVTNDSVRHELFFIKPTMMEACNLIAGYAAVQDVRFERKARARMDGLLNVVAKARLPGAAAQQEAAAVCAAVQDDELRATLARLGGWVMGGRE